MSQKSESPSLPELYSSVSVKMSKEWPGYSPYKVMRRCLRHKTSYDVAFGKCFYCKLEEWREGES